MSPSQPESVAAQLPQAHVREPTQTIQTSQPAAPQPMDPTRAPAESKEQGMGLRGGRGDMCPGRFCFCVPCPIPCDCCII